MVSGMVQCAHDGSASRDKLMLARCSIASSRASTYITRPQCGRSAITFRCYIYVAWHMATKLCDFANVHRYFVLLLIFKVEMIGENVDFNVYC
jgi:hypothetical protein